MWKCTGSWQLGARLPERVPRAVGRGRARRGPAGRTSCSRRARRARATRLASATQVSMSHAGISGIGRSRLPESAWISAMLVVVDLDHQPAQRLVVDHAEVLAAEPDGAREDDLRVDAALVEHLEPHLRVVRADVDVVDRPLVERDVGALLLAVAADDAAGAGLADGRGRRTPRSGSPSTSSTRGTRSLYSAGATLVKRSCGSDQCESASMTSVSVVQHRRRC